MVSKLGHATLLQKMDLRNFRVRNDELYLGPGAGTLQPVVTVYSNLQEKINKLGKFKMNISQ